MNNEKALEALKAFDRLIKIEEDHIEMRAAHGTKRTVADQIADAKAVRSALLSPFDEAIKIVEDKREQEQKAHDAVDSFIENWEKFLHTVKIEACDELLSALKARAGK